MKRISVLVLEDDILVQKKFKNLSTSFPHISICECTGDSNRAFEYTTKSFPHVAIVDLELQNGVGSGLSYLQKISSSPYKPYIIVTTNITSKVTYDAVRNLGADYIFCKHQCGYDEADVMDIIMIMKDTILQDDTLMDVPSSELDDDSYKKKVRSLLYQIGFSPRLCGTEYIVEVALILRQHSDSDYISILSREHSKTKNCIQRNIRTAIQATWTQSNLINLQKYNIPVMSGKDFPTNVEFISWLQIQL